MNAILATAVLAWLNVAPIFPPQAPGQWPRLLDIARSRGVPESGSGYTDPFLFTFTRAGIRREALVLLPGMAFETDELPPTNTRCVSLAVAMPFNLGDGAVLRVLGDGNAGRQEFFQLALDPAHVRADRRWVPVRFEVPAGNGEFALRFEVSAGPRGDQTGDWIGVAPGEESGCLLAEPRPLSPLDF